MLIFSDCILPPMGKEPLRKMGYVMFVIFFIVYLTIYSSSYYSHQGLSVGKQDVCPCVPSLARIKVYCEKFQSGQVNGVQPPQQIVFQIGDFLPNLYSKSLTRLTYRNRQPDCKICIQINISNSITCNIMFKIQIIFSSIHVIHSYLIQF